MRGEPGNRSETPHVREQSCRVCQCLPSAGKGNRTSSTFIRSLIGAVKSVFGEVLCVMFEEREEVLCAHGLLCLFAGLGLDAKFGKGVKKTSH